MPNLPPLVSRNMPPVSGTRARHLSQAMPRPLLLQHIRATVLSVQAPRFINSKGHKRGPQPELLILNYDPAQAGRLPEPPAGYD